MKFWADETRKQGFDLTKKSTYDNAILKNQRELEDMEREIKALIGKSRRQPHRVWKEVNVGIERVANLRYQIVLGYGDPIEKETAQPGPRHQTQKWMRWTKAAACPSMFTAASICRRRLPTRSTVG